MAASYIRIAVLVLVGLAVLSVGIGFAVGKWGNKPSARRKFIALFTLAGGSCALLFVMLLGARSLPVSGSLINRQIMALWMEILWALMCGGIAGLLPAKKNSVTAITLGIPTLLCLLAVGYQIKNIQPVLDTLQTAGLLKPRDDYKPETNKDCPANLQSVYNAFEQYAELNDKLPDAAKWQDDTDFTSRIPQDEWLHCPAVSNRHDDRFGYALNDAVAGKKLNLNGKPLKSLPNAATTPLLYDSTDTNKNAHDAVTSLPRPGRHGGRDNVLYLDGHVAAVAPK